MQDLYSPQYFSEFPLEVAEGTFSFIIDQRHMHGEEPEEAVCLVLRPRCGPRRSLGHSLRDVANGWVTPSRTWKSMPEMTARSVASDALCRTWSNRRRRTPRRLGLRALGVSSRGGTTHSFQPWSFQQSWRVARWHPGRRWRQMEHPRERRNKFPGTIGT